MEQLGIEPSLLLAQIINFSIIVFVLGKLLYKPILDMLEKRRREIAQGLELTEKMREESERMAVKREKLLEAARKETHVILEDGRRQAKEEEKDILDDAHKQADEIIAKGKVEADRLHEEMRTRIRVQAVDLAVVMAKRLLSSVLTGADQHKILQKHIKELTSVQRSQ